MRALLLGVAVVTACGGKVVVDPTATPDASGVGGAGASTSSSPGSGASVVASTGDGSSSASGMACPDPWPGISAPCDLEGTTCGVPNACCGGTAVCQNGFWMYQPMTCPDACGAPCGPNEFTCEPSTVCVAFIGKITTYLCEPNPCADAPLACSCADPLCEAADMYCNNVEQGDKVLCDCKGQC